MERREHRDSSLTIKSSTSDKARSVDVFSAVREIQSGAASAASSTLTLQAPPGATAFPKRISAAALGTFEIPGVPGEWRVSGILESSSPSRPQSMYLMEELNRQSGQTTPTLTPEELPQRPEPSLSRIHEVAFIINICLSQLLSLAALSQTVVPLPLIAAYFKNNDPGQLSWFTAAYGLTVGTFILPAGRLGDMYGHKLIFMFGWAWFSLGSVICGMSRDHITLSAFRAIQGIGPALIIPNGMALVGRTFPMGMKRNLVFSLFGACGPTGWVVGAVFSSICAQLGAHTLHPSGWAWSFIILSIVCAMICVGSYFIIPAPPPGSPSPKAPARKFDVFGTITGVTSLILINFAFNQAPLVGWSTYVCGLLVVGILFIIVFIYVELNIAEQPLVPIRGLQKEAGFVLGCIAAGWGSHGVWIYYFYLFLEGLRGLTPLEACLQTFPVALTGVCFALSVGHLLKRIKVAYVMTISMAFFAVGTVLIATAPVHQTYWAQTFLSVILMPGGMNLSFPAGTILLSNALPKEHQGIAASLITTMVNYSISTGLGIAGTINVNVDPTMTNPLAAFRAAWWFGMGLSCLGLVISLWFVWKSR